MDELESLEDNVRKDNFCGAEESTGKEIKIGAGAGSRENITKYTEDVSQDSFIFNLVTFAFHLI